ncbi:MAG TPA: ABC transporter permease, partial [Planctomycetota bacterium]|nr:ABC transporter permease [Planctomycetota bacterium]
TLAVGGNEEAARTAGLPVQRIKVLCYTIAGALGGVASLLYLSFSGSIQSGDARGYELTVIAAAVIGGASLSGGRGTAIGALLGALFLELLKNSLFTLQIPQNYEQLVIGVVIVSAAGFNRLRERLTDG